MPLIDFDRVQEMIHLADAAKALGVLKGRFNPLWSRCPCPVCKHQDQRCCHVQWDKGRWYCHRCERGGGVIQLAWHLLHDSWVKVAETLCLRLGLEVPYKTATHSGKKRRDASGEIHGGDDDDDVLSL
jgi:CHC2-type zinc finger protein